jgi:hypothetical protein
MLISIGSEFEIKESGRILLVTARNKEKDPVFTVKYVDKSKQDLHLSESQIKRLVSFGSWIKK